jgi:hypothetical protein
MVQGKVVVDGQGKVLLMVKVIDGYSCLWIRRVRGRGGC